MLLVKTIIPHGYRLVKSFFHRNFGIYAVSVIIFVFGAVIRGGGKVNKHVFRALYRQYRVVFPDNLPVAFGSELKGVSHFVVGYRSEVF